MASKAIVGEKVGMTQVWDDQNRAVPVTVLKVAPVRVVQVKTPETDGYAALQVTWGFRRATTLSKPESGHYAKAGVNPGRKLVELRLDDVADYTVGQELAADLWEAGERGSSHQSQAAARIVLPPPGSLTAVTMTEALQMPFGAWRHSSSMLGPPLPEPSVPTSAPRGRWWRR